MTPREHATFAVVIPVFNGPHSFIRAFESAEGQVPPAHEIVVVDDASSDDMSVAFDRVTRAGGMVLRQSSNHGPAAARNRGAAASRAEWLVFLDADDELAPSALGTFSASSAPGVGLLKATFSWKREGASGAVAAFLPGAFAVRRDLFLAVGGYDEELRYAENSELLMRLKREMRGSALVESTIDVPTVTKESAGESRNYDKARMLAAIRILEKHQQYFTQHRDERAQHEAIAAVNAMRVGRRDVARRYAWRAVVSEPARFRHSARFVKTLVLPAAVERR
jgi:glycosyltransferase involved in cell wall biosynthesis